MKRGQYCSGLRDCGECNGAPAERKLRKMEAMAEQWSELAEESQERQRWTSLLD